MSKVWQGKVAEEFNRSFNEPFMPDGFCEAEIDKNGRGERILRIRLGDRDVAFDGLGNSIGSGSNVGEAVKWNITRR
ncbi:unnamed protein product [marine sediment metagenome]|uniref:Uncharacterized protein n=1 Tax=marine sediment metagenome TaxID=412755 RepID=X1N9R2_9ZZZZ